MGTVPIAISVAKYLKDTVEQVPKNSLPRTIFDRGSYTIAAAAAAPDTFQPRKDRY